ncbi:MAG TPA: HNH endonuclease, partial [Flavobacterium sp.]|nr:HNH endonuclease [Flavobacterium sp.]
SVVVGTILTGPAKTVASVLTSGAYEEYAAQVGVVKDKLSTYVTAQAYGTSTGKIEVYTDPALKDQISKESQETIDWSKDVSESKEGARFLVDIVEGMVVGGVGKGIAKTTKIDGNNVEVSVAGVGNRGELTKPYDPNQTRKDLETVHGAENVKSTTVVNDPYQRVNSNKEKGIEVVYDSYGNKAVKVEYKDPLTGETKFANTAYDDRKLPIFDDYSTYTTKIQKPDGYASMSNDKRRREEMKLATKDLKEQIQSGKISKNDFTPQQLAAINSGSDTIPGYTWHHNAQSKPNNFQLLPREIHDAVKHIGEASLSGGK